MVFCDNLRCKYNQRELCTNMRLTISSERCVCFEHKRGRQKRTNESDINIWKLDAQAGGLNVNVDRAEQDGVKVTSATSIDSGTSGSVTLYFEDIMGVQTEATINFVKE